MVDAVQATGAPATVCSSHRSHSRGEAPSCSWCCRRRRHRRKRSGPCGCSRASRPAASSCPGGCARVAAAVAIAIAALRGQRRRVVVVSVRAWCRAVLVVLRAVVRRHRPLGPVVPVGSASDDASNVSSVLSSTISAAPTFFLRLLVSLFESTSSPITSSRFLSPPASVTDSTPAYSSQPS